MILMHKLFRTKYLLECLVVACSCMATVSIAAEKDAYPTKPVTFLVPYAPGGTTDVLARIVAKAMSPVLGQTIIVENAGGAGGTIGTRRVVRAAPDGYTLTVGNMGSLAANVSLYPNLGFDPRQDLAPVGVIARVPMMLAAGKNSGVKDLQGFVERLKTEGEKVSFGQAGAGSTGHLAAARLVQLVGSKATIVPYRGTGPAINDLLAGVVDGVIDQTVTMIPVHKGGRAIGLAVSGKSRLPQIPDVPTFAEGGLPAFDLVVWNAIAAPKDTPPAVIGKLVKALDVALNDPELKQRFNDLAAEAPPPEERGPGPLSRTIADEVERLSELIKAADIKAE
jgi:tripartite-type tricarboxylate transporter receptor subunit TctC